MSFEPRTKSYWTDGVDDPHSLLGRSKLNELILGHPKVAIRHIVVWSFHLRRAHKDYAWTSLASERFMVEDLRGAFDGRWGLARQHIRKAHGELVEWKFLALAHKGGGKGDGSRYWPNFDLLEQAAAGRFSHDVSITVPSEVVARYGCLQPAIAAGNCGVPSTEPGTTGFPVLGTTGFPVKAPTGNYGVPKDITTRSGSKSPDNGSVIDNSTPGAGGPLAAAPGDAFERLFAAYDKPGDDAAKARRALRDINPGADEIERMVAAAVSWKRTSKGGRMSLERWLREKRWLSNDAFANDNRKTHKWPSCVVTHVKPKYDDDGSMETFYFKYRDRDGLLQTRVLGDFEFSEFRDQVKADRPGVIDPSKDMHEFIGARFQADDDGMFSQYTKQAA
ncbi:MAG: hypothetical protein EOS07_35545 [Mesorhizobium sp.]|nr:MAG: hypothetical protein EOS07_35545 [Mesorhizobium sp.]